MLRKVSPREEDIPELGLANPIDELVQQLSPRTLLLGILLPSGEARTDDTVLPSRTHALHHRLLFLLLFHH